MIHDVVDSSARLVPASALAPGVAAAVVLLVLGIGRPLVCHQKARLFASLVAVAVCPAPAAPCTMAGIWLDALLRRAL